jgi:hypothetical protein
MRIITFLINNFRLISTTILLAIIVGQGLYINYLKDNIEVIKLQAENKQIQADIEHAKILAKSLKQVVEVASAASTLKEPVCNTEIKVASTNHHKEIRAVTKHEKVNFSIDSEIREIVTPIYASTTDISVDSININPVDLSP